MLQQNTYKEALTNAIASVEMEGYDITEEQKISCLDFLDGKIDKKDFIKAVLEGCLVWYGIFFRIIIWWAGKIRTVNMSKKGTDFCNFKEIEENGTRIFNRLKNSNYLKVLQEENFIDEFTDIFCELNYLHPFREGNGRVQRLFLSMLLKDLNKKIDFSKIDKDLFMIATIKSVSGDVFMLKDIFLNNIEQI